MDDEQLIKQALELVRRSSEGKEILLKLVERVEELTPDKEPTSIVWEPKKGDEYFYVATTEYLNSNIWVGSVFELSLLKHHNVYKTRELAEKAAECQMRYNRVLQAVLNLEPDQKVDRSDENQSKGWMDTQWKYHVLFDHKAGLFRGETTWRTEEGFPPLTDEKNVQPLLDYLNGKEKSDE